MSEHKCPLVIIGQTHKGKTTTLALAAFEYYERNGDWDNIVIFVNDETTPSRMIEQLESKSKTATFPWAATARNEQSDFFFFATPEIAVELCEKFNARQIHLFVDCVSQTSIGVDHEGIRVSFQGIHGEQLNSLLAMASLQGVTVSNWGS